MIDKKSVYLIVMQHGITEKALFIPPTLIPYFLALVWVGILAAPLTSCVTLGKPLELSEVGEGRVYGGVAPFVFILT